MTTRPTATPSDSDHGTDASRPARRSLRQMLVGNRLGRALTAIVATGAVAAGALVAFAPANASDLNPNHTCWATGDDGISTVAANPAGQGYWNLSEADKPGAGNLLSVDGAPVFRGSDYGGILRATPDGGGLYLVDTDGTIHNYGDAVNFGSVSDHSGYSADGCGDTDDNRIASVSVTPSGKGLIALDEEGYVWAVGDAHYYGQEPLDGDDRFSAIAETPDGGGYTLLAKDGSVYTFGDAHFYGHTGVTGDATALVTTKDGKGYWIMNSAGQTWAFGDAPSVGDLPATSGTANRYVDADRLADGTGIIATTEAGNVVQEDATPFALNGITSAVSGTPTVIHLAGRSADGFPIEHYGIVDGPIHGTVSTPDSNGDVTYTPNLTQTGTTDAFTFDVIADGTVSRPGTIQINISRNPNCASICASDAASHAAH